jgi:hypothetical protein
VIVSGLFECCYGYKGVAILKKAKYFCNNVRKIMKIYLCYDRYYKQQENESSTVIKYSCVGITHIILVSTYIKQFWPDLIKPSFLLHRLSVYKFCGVNVIFK